MDDKDRRTLQVNRTYLVKNIANPDDIAEELFSNEIFTEGMKDEIEVEKLREKKVRKLLDILPRRGPEAFKIFLNVLVDTQNKHVAEHINSGQKVPFVPHNQLHHREEEEDLPQTWPDPISLEGPLIVKPCSINSTQFQSSRCYKMGRKPRGRVLVINNKIFFGPLEKDDVGMKRVTLTNREGTDKDEEKIKEVFEQMNFVVDVFLDKKGEDIKDILRREVEKDIHRTADCFVLVIMTHGTTGAIYGVDGKTVSVEEIKKQFNGENFPAMADKPKVILIQACRGDDRDQGVREISNTDEEIKKAEQKMKDMTLNSETDSHSETLTPTMSHMVVAMASTLGMVSFRNKIYGSWFLQAVAFVLAKYSYKDDILQILTKVNELVSRGRAKDSRQRKEYVAISEFNSTLSKSLYFCPGLVTEEVQSNRIQQASS
ncbi:caspase-6-like [Saccostrea echinata]|uniref:caspase-6-like n=1 Tax=Saccostrea echinata TaxID=191078 RepID=UPI002A803A4D|nr:caspase-6-like [Saccostrea echinata]